MTQSKTGRKALALFLAMMMLFSLLPASAMAEDPVTEEEIIEEGNEDSFIEDEIFEEEIIEEEPVYEEELFFEEEQPAEETEEVDEEAGLSLSDSETFDSPPGETSGDISGGISIDPITVAVTGVTLDKTTLELGVNSTAALTATVIPENATDRKVKWSTGANRVALYADSGCTIPVGTEPTDKLTVYVKGESAGTTTITVTVEENDAKSATCSVTVLTPVSYLDAEGNTKYCNEYTVVTGATDELNDGWYVVPAGEQVDTNRMTVTGNVHLILCDGATLKNGGITVQDSDSLTIYAQSAEENTGKLIADGYTGNINIAGIGGMSNEGASGNAGTITINGGIITAYGGEYSAGIGGASNNNNIHGNGGTVTINGGEVTAIGGKNAAAIGAAYGGNPGTVTLGDGMIAYAGADNLNTEYIANFAENHGQKYAHVYAGEAPVQAPRFADQHQVLLGSEINLMFQLILPDGFSSNTSSVDFVVDSGRTRSAEVDISSGDQWVSCPLNALELADNVKVTYTYDGGTVEANYNVVQYFDDLRGSSVTTEAQKAVINALQNYGYYMQQTSWTDRRDHTSIAKVEDTDISSLADAKQGLDGKDISAHLESSGIENVRFTLTMNSKTIVNVYFNPKHATEVPEAYNSHTQIDGLNYYIVNSQEFGPKDLGSNKTVQAKMPNWSGTAAVYVCPMSYVKAVLDGVQDGATLTAKQQALIAFYDYWNAARQN